MDPFYTLAAGPAAVGVADVDRGAQRQAKPVDDRLGKDQLRRPGIDQALDPFTANLLRGQVAVLARIMSSALDDSNSTLKRLRRYLLGFAWPRSCPVQLGRFPWSLDDRRSSTKRQRHRAAARRQSGSNSVRRII